MFGDLILKEKIGEGSSAEVFRVEHAILGGTAALKWWRHPLAAGDERHFVAECQLQKRISDHPNIVKIQWAEAPLGHRPWLVADLYDESLLDLLVRSPQLSSAQAFVLADGMLAGLSEIHRLEHVHRDVKPANILLKDGVPALGDLGITMLVGSDTVASAAGTAGYRAPELALGSSPTYRSDVYSAGMTLRAVFGLDCPTDVDDLLTRATSHRPEDRPADAAKFRGSLAALNVANVVVPARAPAEEVRSRVGRRRSSRRPRRVVAVVAAPAVALVLAASGVYVAQGSTYASSWLTTTTGAAEVASDLSSGAPPPVGLSSPSPGGLGTPTPTPVTSTTPVATSKSTPTQTSDATPAPSDAPASVPLSKAEVGSTSPTRPVTSEPSTAAITQAVTTCDRSPRLSGIPKSTSDPVFVVRGSFPCKPASGRSRLVVIELSDVGEPPHREYYLKWAVPASKKSWSIKTDVTSSGEGQRRDYYVVDLTAKQLRAIRGSERAVDNAEDGYYGGDGDDAVGEVLHDARRSPMYPSVWTGWDS